MANGTYERPQERPTIIKLIHQQVGFNYYDMTIYNTCILNERPFTWSTLKIG